MDLDVIAAGMTTPGAWEEAPLPRKNGPKDLLPSTWLSRELRVEYTAPDGTPATTTGVLLDLYPFGPVVLIAGAKTLIAWERLRLIELVDD